MCDERLRVALATPACEVLLGAALKPGVPLAAALEKGLGRGKSLAGGGAAAVRAAFAPASRAATVSVPWPGGALEIAGTRIAGGWLLRLAHLREGAGEPLLFHGMWTCDPAMRQLFALVEKAAADDVTILVRGETGSGKELVAEAIHACSPRKRGPFRAINCAALPGNLLESELFGHARGAFTGAHRDTPGHLQLAHKGTLFLDEVAELPLDLQAKLLRVLETRTVLPVGAREPVPVDVRFVSATHRALRKEVEAGRFRADLMYRLRVIPLFLPPLRDRRGDIPLLVAKLMETMNRERRRRIDAVSPAALDALVAHDWPGNVRELKNALSYAYVMGEGPLLVRGDLPPELRERDVLGTPSPDREAILEALRRAGGQRHGAAELLGMSRVTLWRRMRELGLVPPRKKRSG